MANCNEYELGDSAGAIDVVNFAQNKVKQAMCEAQVYLDEIKESAEDESIKIDGNWSFTPWSVSLTTGDIGSIPYLAPVGDINAGALVKHNIKNSFDLVTDLDLPDAPEIEVWDNNAIPAFNEEAPNLDLPDVPTTPLPSAPSDHEVQDIILNDWTEYDLPDAPIINESPLPTPDELNIQAMDMSLPVLDITIPSNDFSFVETDYSSALKDAIENTLQGDIENGGSGINPIDEQRLFERARDRLTKQTSVIIRQVQRNSAARGFPLPPGYLMGTENAAIEKGKEELNGLNRELTLKRADLYVQARQFAIQQGLSLEQAMLSYTSAKYERALNAAKLVAEFSVQFHNLGVEHFQLKMGLTGLYRDLHAEHLQTVLTKTKEYEQKIQHIEAESGQNESRLKIHNQLLSGVKLAYDAQQARDQHTLAQLEVEQLKLQGAKLSTEIYVAKTRARGDEFNTYKIGVQAQGTVLSLFDSKLAAHERQVDIISKESDIKRDKFKAELELAEAKERRFKVLLTQNELKVREASAYTDALLRDNRHEIEEWKQLTSVKEFNTDKEFKHNLEQVNKRLEGYKVNLSQVNIILGRVLELKNLNVESAKSALSLYENMIAGAEGSLSAITSLSE